MTEIYNHCSLLAIVCQTDMNCPIRCVPTPTWGELISLASWFRNWCKLVRTFLNQVQLPSSACFTVVRVGSSYPMTFALFSSKFVKKRDTMWGVKSDSIIRIEFWRLTYKLKANWFEEPFIWWRNFSSRIFLFMYQKEPIILEAYTRYGR